MIDARRRGVSVGAIVVGTTCASAPVADAAPVGARVKTIVSHYGTHDRGPGSGRGGLSSLKVGGGLRQSTVTAELADEGSLNGKAVC
ncbi:hypothetical protein OG948_37930 (plasmid) [Embleya sp. NBC_00888]|uniref:hypothetical protein n=1 Tax=Embleya sp. NBC_00888 TaxID=2975960 RepID=UPI002F9170EC|nr:hypothetical protein OG948_37930 [Embleya sp. NBC_00888]